MPDWKKLFDSATEQVGEGIPARIDAKVDVGGKLGDLLSAAQAIKSMTESPIHWTLVAFLDIPWKRNLSKEIDLSVHESRSRPPTGCDRTATSRASGSS